MSPNLESEDHSEKNVLQALLFGCSMSSRGSNVNVYMNNIGKQIDCIIREIIAFLVEEHSRESRGLKQAEREMYEIYALPNANHNSIVCKRAIILFTLWHEPVFARRFRRYDSEFMDDLTQRVLPVTAPFFLANLGQRPDAFVALCATLSTMWKGEPIALRPNWKKPS